MICVIGIGGVITFNVFEDGYYREWIMMMMTVIGAFGGGTITLMGVILTLNRDVEKENILKREKIYKTKKIIKREFELFIKSVRIKQSLNIFNPINNDSEYGVELYKIRFDIIGLLDALILLEDIRNIDCLILIREKYEKYLEFEKMYFNNIDRLILWEYFNKEFLSVSTNIYYKKFILDGCGSKSEEKFIEIINKENSYDPTIKMIFDYLDKEESSDGN